MRYQVSVTESAPHTVLRLRRQVGGDTAGEDIAAGMRELYDRARAARLRQVGLPRPPTSGGSGRAG